MKTNKTEKKSLNFDGFEGLQSEMKVLIKGGDSPIPQVCQAGGPALTVCDRAGKKD